MNLREGATLARGRYALRSRIAVGGMGEIWRAFDTYTRRDVAIKVLRPEFKGNSDFLQRLRIEARNTQALKHPNIAELYGHGEEDGSGYLVMELVEGESLSDRLDREGILPLRDVLHILAQTAHGLHAAHEAGIIHRDVKPGNILLRGDDVKITDFGISLSAGQAPITATGMVMGTAQYLPPEQALGKPATPAGDLYALGIVAYESLVGHRPFTGETEVDIALAHVREPVPPMPDGIDPEVVALIMQMLDKDPENRPESAEALAKLFEAKLATLPPAPAAPTPAPDSAAGPVAARRRRERTDTETHSRLPLPAALAAQGVGVGEPGVDDGVAPPVGKGGANARTPGATPRASAAAETRPAPKPRSPHGAPPVGDGALDETTIVRPVRNLDETRIGSAASPASPPQDAPPPGPAASTTAMPGSPTPGPTAASAAAPSSTAPASQAGPTQAPAPGFVAAPKPPPIAPHQGLGGGTAHRTESAEEIGGEKAAGGAERTPADAHSTGGAGGPWRKVSGWFGGQGPERTWSQRLLLFGVVVVLAIAIGLMCWVLSRALSSASAADSAPTSHNYGVALPGTEGPGMGPWRLAMSRSGTSDQVVAALGASDRAGESASSTEGTPGHAPEMGARREMTARL